MANVVHFGVNKSQKKIIYLIMVSVLLGMFFVLLYLVFLLLNTQSPLIKLSDGTTQIVGSVLAVLGAIFGRPLGKKWWKLVYIERKKGAVLKVK